MSYLWIYTSIAGALLGAACLAYIRETKIGLWGYKQFDRMLDWLRDRYGLTWFDQPEDAWRGRARAVKKLQFFDGMYDHSITGYADKLLKILRG